jgi:hypothetical protein
LTTFVPAASDPSGISELTSLILQQLSFSTTACSAQNIPENKLQSKVVQEFRHGNYQSPVGEYFRSLQCPQRFTLGSNEPNQDVKYGWEHRGHLKIMHRIQIYMPNDNCQPTTPKKSPTSV